MAASSEVESLTRPCSAGPPSPRGRGAGVRALLPSRLACIFVFLLILKSAFPLLGADTEPTFAKATYTYKTVEGHAIKTDVYRPADNRVRPVILFLHGGALIFGDRTGIRNAQLGRYLKEGFVVVS